MIPGLTPHGPGFSFLDSVEFLNKGHSLRAIKWLNPKSEFFKHHFPGEPLMPGVLLVESAAQAAGALWGSIHRYPSPHRYALAQVHHFRFNRPVLPGQSLTIEVSMDKDFGSLAQFTAELSVDGKNVASGNLILSQVQAAVNSTKTA